MAIVPDWRELSPVVEDQPYLPEEPEMGDWNANVDLCPLSYHTTADPIWA
jgi:hypothetical protein